MDPANNRHPFYNWLTSQFTGALIVECGTARGGSASSWSSNLTNLVITYDIQPNVQERIVSRPNVISKILDCNKISPEWLAKADILFLDISHNGDDEQLFLSRIEPYFKGILIMDDVNCPRRWKKLNRLFNNLEREHHLLPSSIGQLRGTGVVAYGDWTVVIKEDE